MITEIKIKKELINELLQGCKNVYPNEFFALLRSNNNVIDEYVVVPIIYQNENSVSYRTDLLPLGFKISGSIHSHPSGSNMPSDVDLNSFIHLGNYHFIIKYPFRFEDIACYDYEGNKINIIFI